MANLSHLLAHLLVVPGEAQKIGSAVLYIAYYQMRNNKNQFPLVLYS